MTLEELRYENLGLIHVAVAEKGKDGVLFVVHFHNFAQLAYKNTLLSLGHLNTPGIVTAATDASINATSYWFFTVESFINTLWKVISVIDRSVSFESIRKKDLLARLSELLSVLAVDLKPFYRDGSYARFNEFLQFRNDIFHDRQHGTPMDYRKTSFSRVPPLVNQVDVLQSMIIAIELCGYLRYVFPDLDIMPEVAFFPNGTIAFEKMDIIFATVVKPTFVDLLKRQDLHSKLDMSYSNRVVAN